MTGYAGRLDWFYVPFCLVFIAAGMVLTFGPMIADPGHPDFLGVGDAWVENGPKLFYVDHVLRGGELPLWNPLTFCGHPAAANPQYFAFYPPNLARSFLTGEPTPYKTHVGIAWMVFFHLLFAGFTTFLLARSHGLSGPGAMIAAFAFVFSAPMISRAFGHWQFDVMVSWAPLNLLLLRKGMLSAGRGEALAWYLGLGIAFGMTLLGGSPHFMLLIGFLLAFYWTFSRVLLRDDVEGGILQLCARDGVFGGLALLIAVMVAAPMLLPAVEFSGFSARTAGAGPEIITGAGDDWPLWRRLIVYTGTQNYEAIRACGAGVLLLAVMALVAHRSRVMGLFLVLFLVFLDFSLNEPLWVGRLLTELAPYSISSPGRAMLVACLPLGMLAGLGFDGMTGGEAGRREMVGRSAVLLVVGAGVLWVVYANSRPHAFLEVGWGVVLMPLLLLLTVLAGPWFREWIIVGAVAAMLLMGESLSWNRPYIRDSLRPGLTYPAPMETLKGPRRLWQGNERWTHDEPNLNLYDLAPIINGHDPLHMARVRDALCHPGEGDVFRRRIQPVEVTAYNFHGNGYLKRAFWLARKYVNGPAPDWDTVFPYTTTVYLEGAGELGVPEVARETVPKRPVSERVTEEVIISREDTPVVIAAGDGEPGEGVTWATRRRLPDRHGGLAVAFSATGSVELRMVFGDLETGRREYGRFLHLDAVPNRVYRYELPAPDFRTMEIGIVAVFDGGDGMLRIHELVLMMDEADEGGQIHMVERTANTVEVEVRELAESRILTFVDSDYPGWRAMIDGEPVPILRANGAFKAVEVPPGTHRVRFEFRPWRVRAGMASAAAGLLVACSVVGFVAGGRLGARGLQVD